METPSKIKITVYSSIAELYSKFVFTAKTYGKIIISEVYLPDSETSIKPINVGGVCGGPK